MKTLDIIQVLFFILILTVLTPLLGKFMYKVFAGKKNFLTPIFGKLENLIYKFLKVNPEDEMNWKRYLWAVLIFNFAGFIFLFILQIIQQWLPFNPQSLPNVPSDLAFNTAVSFMTNTNWQAYAGENTMSYAVQMLGLTVQNFLSAATGIAVLLALIRGITIKLSNKLGNFWVDMVRAILYVLIPLSVFVSILLISQGVVQNFSPYAYVKTLEGINQLIPLGPAASQTAIKLLGTNGGGFFNVNSAHPFENPTPLSNFIEVISLIVISAALTYTYGMMAGSKKEGWILYGVMLFLMVCGIVTSLYSEYLYNPILNTASNLEGKELRFGIVNSIIWSTATTGTSCGAVNAMHSSLSPLAGMVAMINIMLGEIVFGGVGSGMYGMLIFVFITVFIAGLMVGRTPEYLGKKIESFDVKMAMIAVLIPNIIILVFTATAIATATGLSSIANSGPHGLSEILYAFSSSAGNNGSAFAGLNANTVFYNLSTGIAMLLGRFGVIIPVMAIAGNLVKKNKTPVSAGTFTTDNYVFAVLLIGVILIVGALTHFPALSLGPIVEHLLMNNGVAF
ncbi:MAG: potassium-transporting ATPase subunit KdpA [Ignavibacteriae bacterium]|nr:potassium-transporting ATPase subunit KdpA [Ignavibacteriota bacterium]